MLLYVYKSELSDRLGLISQRIRPQIRPGEQLNKKQGLKASLYVSSGTGDSSPERQKYSASSEASLSKPVKLGLAVPPKEILLMFVCYPYPRKVMQFLQRTSVRIEESDPGIYRFRLWCIDAAIIVQSRLDSAKYLWMKNLSSNVPPEDFDLMAAQQQNHPEDKALDDLIQFIYDNNPYLQKEGGKMCKMIQILLRDGQINNISAVTRDEKVRHIFYEKYNL